VYASLTTRRASRRIGRTGRSLIAGLIAIISIAPLVLMSEASPVSAAGTPDISLSESAPATVLYGATATVSLTASNPSGSGGWGYNLSYEDVLPAGVSYVGGSTTPASVGDPQSLANVPSTNDTTLIWSNVSDLSPGSSNTLTFALQAATDVDPAPNFLPNQSYSDSTSAYIDSDPRQVPQFDSDGMASNFTGSATSGGTTSLSPLAISQSPSGAELRGIHDHRFVSTITVTNNSVHATDNISVTDYLAAGLEYLLCGQTDNTSDAPTNPDGGPDEYPGSPGLSGGVSSPPTCVTPTTVTTVDTNPGGLPTAVYTEVQWNDVGSLAPSASLTIEFVAGIPIRANTMTWSSGSAPSGLGQAANLDNNSGAETVDGTSLPIYATATGTYTGTLGSGANPVAATDHDTIVARDIVTSKAVSDPSFSQGQDVTFTITVSTSEYRYSDDTTVTDTLPSGMCPLGSENYDAQDAPECAPTAGETPSPAYTSVAENADGSFTLVWDLGHMAPSATDSISFPAADRIFYQNDDTNTTPTVGNDTLSNTEIASGNLSVRCDSGDPNCTGTGQPISHDTPLTVDGVTATASATQSAPGPTITVDVSQNVAAGTPLDCGTATYLSSSSPGYPPIYQKGDLICFKIDVDYPPGTDFKNPTVTDFIPPNSAYQSGSATVTGASTASNVSFSQPVAGELEWAMGSQLATPDGNLYESPGTLFEVEFSVIATADPTLGNAYDLTQDLAKLVTANTGGTTFAGRDLVTYELAAPIVTLTKAVTTIDGNPAPQRSGDTVRGGDTVGYTLTVRDTGIVDAHDVEVWDVLPVQDACSDVSEISPASGSCATASPSDIIEWPASAIPDLAAGASATLTYTMIIPATAGAGETFTNTGGAVTYTGEHNDSGQPVNTYYPASNIDSGVSAGEENAPAADEAADVVSSGALVTKSRTTNLASPGGNTEATIGDTITYTVGVTVPYDTTFYNAVLSDPLGSQQDYVTGSGQVTLPDGSTLTEAGGSSEGFTYAHNSGSNTVSLTFPATYPNTSGANEQLTITYRTTVGDVAGNVRNAAIDNTATLNDDTSTGSLVTSSASVSTTVVEPDVTIGKAANPTELQPGATDTFTITVANPSGSGVSSAYDLDDGTDTIPTTPAPGLAYVAGSVALAGPAAGTVSESGGVVTWSIPELDPGQSDTISYQVTGPPSADLSNGESWTNTATLASWDGISGGPAGSRGYGPASASVTLPAQFLDLVTTKSTPDGSTALAGQSFTWEVKVTNQATVADADTVAVTDTLPAGWTYDAGSTTITFPSGPASHADPTVSGATLSWSGLGTLDPGQTLTVEYQATPSVSLDTASTTGPSYPYPNSAYATAQDNTGAAGNSSGAYQSNTSTTDAYIGQADLQITKSHSGNFEAGADGSYTLSVKNNGPSAAGAPITAVDTMVSPETYVSASGTGWVCSFASPTVTCTMASPLSSGTTASPITLRVDTPSSTANGQIVTNTATVTSPTYDPNLANNSSSDPTTIDAEADLQITKSHTGDFTAGSQGTYNVSTYNNGPSDAVGPLTMTDTLPAAETLVSATGSGWTCNPPSGGTFTCSTTAGLVAGTYAEPITLVVTVASSQAPGTITNTASVSSPTDDPNLSNNTSGDVTTIVTSADLSLTKVHQGSFVAGDDGDYAMTVSNGGPSGASGPITVTDPLPSGETLVGCSGAGWSCASSSGTVTATHSTSLPAGNQAGFVMTVAIGSGVTVSTLTNTATVGSPTSDPNPANNTSTDLAGTTQSADLQIVKTLTSSLVAGQEATYSLAVTDNGPSDATGPVTLTDSLPSTEGYVSATGTGWICSFSSGTVTCIHAATIVALAPTTTVTLTVSLASDILSQSISNTATVSSPTPDPDSANNSSTATNSSISSADLGITKTDGGPFTAGTHASYTITVSNAGPSDAQGPIVVTDTLPSGETYVSAAGVGWSCSASDQTLTCTSTSALTAGTTAASIDLTVLVASSLAPGPIANSASVSGPTADPNLSNNTASDTESVVRSADLAVTKSHVGDFAAGADGTYTISVTNSGPSDAALPLTVTDPVPSPYTLVSASGGSSWDCSVSGSTATCNALSPLPAGSTATSIAVVVSVPGSQAATEVTNTATVTSVTPDPDPANNSSSNPTEIVNSADLWVTKVNPSSFTAGADGHYLITVGNNGPSPAAAPITVSDTLPGGETYVSATGTGWTCDAASGTVTCTDATELDAGDSAPAVTLTVALASGATGEILNTASVSSPTSDPDPDNNSSTDPVALLYSADLSITKAHSGDFTAGSDGIYTIGVANAGPSDSGTPVVVTDTLPTGETFVSGSGTGWSCTATTTVTCSLATAIAAGADAPALQLSVAVAPAATGVLTNQAAVSGPSPDPNPGNNTASDPTQIDAVSGLVLTKTLDSPLASGATAIYSMSVGNGGPSNSATPVTLTDPLPSGLSFVSSTAGSGGAWSCVAGGGTVTCSDPNPIPAAQTSVFTITVGVHATVGEAITNIATVAAPGDAGNPGEVGQAQGIVVDSASAPTPGTGAAPDPPPLQPGLELIAVGLMVSGWALVMRRRGRWS
jgi:fimbrial isopeptide formation D2 family protein/uncharacterized repeat protein (TIGR01451 family)